MVKMAGVDDEEQYATSVEVDGIRRTLDAFMKKQDANNESMKKSLDDVLNSLSKLTTFSVEDKGSNFKGKKPQNPRSGYTQPPSNHGQDYYPEEIDYQMHENHFVEYDMVDCPWSPEELEKFYVAANMPRQDTTPPPVTNQGPKHFHHQVQPPAAHQVFLPPDNQFQAQMHFQHRIVAKGPKLSFPEFDGTDVDGWIRKAEKYFELVRIPNEDRVQIAVLYIQGKAEFWWRGTGCTAHQLPWHQFCAMLSDRFNETSPCDAIGQFHNLKQTTSVTEFVEKFEELMSSVKRTNPSLTESYFVSSFVSGLKEYIQHHLQCYKPSNLSQAFWYAKRLEQANPPQKKTSFVGTTFKPQKTWNKETKDKDQSSPNIAELRAAGKCFKCREPWIPGHAKVCKAKQVYSLLVMENVEGHEEFAVVEDSTPSEPEEFHDAEPTPVQHLSMHALTGSFTAASTFTLKLQFGKHIATALVDTGSDISFMQAKFAIKSKCHISSVEKIKVAVANGASMFSETA